MNATQLRAARYVNRVIAYIDGHEKSENRCPQDQRASPYLKACWIVGYLKERKKKEPTLDETVLTLKGLLHILKELETQKVIQ